MPAGRRGGASDVRALPPGDLPYGKGHEHGTRLPGRNKPEKPGSSPLFLLRDLTRATGTLLWGRVRQKPNVSPRERRAKRCLVRARIHHRASAVQRGGCHLGYTLLPMVKGGGEDGISGVRVGSRA